MKDWNSFSVHDAPVGAVSFAAISLTAVAFPSVASLDGWGFPHATVLLAICGFLFTPAIICCVYSVAKETSKLLGSAGLVIAPVTVLLQRETLYFVEMGIVLVPCTLVAMMVIAKRRARREEQQIHG